MEVKPSFFSISGFFIPGVVLVSSITSLLLVRYYNSVPVLITAFPRIPAGGAVAALLTALAAAVLLAVTFAMGAVISDTFIYICRQLVLRPIKRSSVHDEVKRLFAHTTIEGLIKADMDAREAYVYMHTCGLDLNWYAGRIRMMGGTGMALLIAAWVASRLSYSWYVFFALIIPALFAIYIALYRSHKFDIYVAATSAVIARGGGVNAKPKE
jgi:hypothetical protein